MYAYISGEAATIGANYIVIEAGGVGYMIYTNAFSISAVSKGQKARLYTHLVVREDELSLYGFATPEEKTMFEKLISISGIGPKVALSLLSSLRISDIAAAVLSANASAFESVSGIGKKTAQRLVLELKEKVEMSDAVGAQLGSGGIVVNAAEEAIMALVNLGYQRNEAAACIAAVKNLGDTAEDLVLLALKRLSR